MSRAINDFTHYGAKITIFPDYFKFLLFFVKILVKTLEPNYVDVSLNLKHSLNLPDINSLISATS